MSLTSTLILLTRSVKKDLSGAICRMAYAGTER